MGNSKKSNNNAASNGALIFRGPPVLLWDFKLVLRRKAVEFVNGYYPGWSFFQEMRPDDIGNL
jgi:hypothetical protein